MKRLSIFISLILLLTSCAVIKNYPQESKFMKVYGGGFIMKSSEPQYGMVVNFKDLPSDAKYLMADFEVPSSPGKYERKVFELSQNQKSVILKSDPIYGYGYGLYYIRVQIAKDEIGENILDSLDQSIKLYRSPYKGRDYATQYSVKRGKEDVKKVVVISPHNRKSNLIEGEIPSGFKMGYAAVRKDQSTIEYIPNNEKIAGWSKIVTVNEYNITNICRSHIQRYIKEIL
jgi:hypothetical protein